MVKQPIHKIMSNMAGSYSKNSDQDITIISGPFALGHTLCILAKRKVDFV